MDIEHTIIMHVLVKNYYCVMLFIIKIEFNLKRNLIYIRAKIYFLYKILNLESRSAN